MRRWIKIWSNEWLKGSIRFDFTSEERGVWADLLALAGNCRQDGLISANETTPYPHSYIAGILNIPEALLEQVLDKCVKSDRISENSHGIAITNWAKYQSEYDRQKPYREKGKIDPGKYTRGKFGHLVHGGIDESKHTE